MKDSYEINIEEIINLAGNTSEHQFYDFKAELNLHSEDKEEEKEKRAEFLKDVLSLANTALLEQQRTFLIIGIKNDGEVCGLESSIDDSEFQSLVSSYIIPEIKFLYKEENYKDKRIGILVILPKGEQIFTISKDYRGAQQKSFLVKGDSFRRMGTVNKKFSNQSELLGFQKELTEKLIGEKEVEKTIIEFWEKRVDAITNNQMPIKFVETAKIILSLLLILLLKIQQK